MRRTLTALSILAATTLTACPNIVKERTACMLSDDVVTVTKHSSSSHGGVGSRIVLDPRTRRITGEVSELIDEKVVKTAVDRTLEAEEWTTLKPALTATCVSVTPLTEPSDFGGGTTYWEVVAGEETIAFANQPSVGPAQWGQLTDVQWDTLIAAWPSHNK